MRSSRLVIVLALAACSEPGGPAGPTAPTPPPFPAAPATRGLLYMTADSAVFLAGPDGSGASRLYFALASGDSSYRLTPASGPAFSADGERLAFVAYPFPPQPIWQRILTARADGSAATPAAGGENAEPCGKEVSALPWAATVAWSPDGGALAFLCAATGPRLLIHVFASGGGYSLWDGAPGPADREPITFSPDGKWVLYGDGLYETSGSLPAGAVRSVVALGLPSAGLVGVGWAANGWLIVGSGRLCGAGVYWMEPRRDAPLVKLLDAPYRYAAFSPDGKKILALTSVCTPGETAKAVVLDAATLHAEVTIPGAVWAAWRP